MIFCGPSTRLQRHPPPSVQKKRGKEKKAMGGQLGNVFAVVAFCHFPFVRTACRREGRGEEKKEEEGRW